tara:strand:+ start:191 stop:1279 length:1089 start_codon:yes stop_codon:yes gene_type:complete
MQKLIDKLTKKEIKKLKRIDGSFEKRFDYLRLDKNERLLPFKKGDLKSFKSSILDTDLLGYAELYKTYKKLAKFLKVNTNQILIAAGSDMAIRSIFETFIKNKDTVLVQSPSYAMTQVYTKMYGAKVKFYTPNNNLKLNYLDINKKINKKTKLVVIENPNGFIGNKLNFREIEALSKLLLKKKILLLIDEAYFYVENNFFDKKKLIKKYPNVIVSQTFSKGHGLAGLRFGYLISNSKLIESLRKTNPLHEVSSLSAKAANWVLDKPRMLQEYKKSIIENKKYLSKELSLLKIRFKMTSANFFLIYIPNKGKTKNFSFKIKQKKILIRKPFEEKNIKGWLRVTIGSFKDSKKFILALRSILKI